MKRAILFSVTLISISGVLIFSLLYKPIVQYTETSFRNIIYKNSDGEKVYLDVYLPTTRMYRKNPVVVFFHGGSWVAGQKEYIAEFSTTVDILRENGVAVISAGYRFVDDFNKYERTITDCTDAMRWVVKNADKYDFDIRRLGTMGFSAGAHLALMSGLAQETFKGETYKNTDYEVDYIVAVSPPANFDIEEMEVISKNPNAHHYCVLMLENFIGGKYEDMKDDYYRASPFAYLENRKHKPDIFLIQGGSDQVVDIQNSYTLKAAAIKNDFNVEFLEIKYGPHRFFDQWYNIEPTKEEVFKKIADYIISHC